jgi:pimeloyl-ACP methyl ester carboxylesterase
MERWLELSHGPTRYFIAGEQHAGPPLLLLHGVGYTYGGSNWLLTLEALGKERCVIAPDILGWGPGGRLRQPYSFAYLVDFVREFQDVLGWPRWDVLGHSMGGWVATLLAYESPERIRRLVLTASGGVATRQVKEMVEFRPPSHDELLADVARRFPHHPTDLEAIAEVEAENVGVPESLPAYQRLLSHMMNPETRSRYNTRRRLTRITAPTLVLWGGEDDVNDLEMGRLVHSLLANSKLAILDCGHFPQTQSPEAFHSEVEGFLQK